MSNFWGTKSYLEWMGGPLHAPRYCAIIDGPPFCAIFLTPATVSIPVKIYGFKTGFKKNGSQKKETNFLADQTVHFFQNFMLSDCWGTKSSLGCMIGGSHPHV